MESGFITNKDKVSFREIVLKQIEKILEIGSKELRDQTFEVVAANHTDIKYQEDTRESYVQSIENLAYILLPHFDKKIEKVYHDCIWVMNAYSFQIYAAFKQELQAIGKARNSNEVPRDYAIKKRIEYAKILFVELNLLLKRVDYLKTAVYSEADSEDNEVVDTDKEKEVN